MVVVHFWGHAAQRAELRHAANLEAARVQKRLPTNSVLLLSLPMTHIVIRMQVLAGGLQRFVPQIVADRAQIDLLVGHMRTSGMA